MSRSEKVLDNRSKYGKLKPLYPEEVQAQSDWLLEQFDKCPYESSEVYMTETGLQVYPDYEGEPVVVMIRHAVHPCNYTNPEGDTDFTGYVRTMFQLVEPDPPGDTYKVCFCKDEEEHQEKYNETRKGNPVRSVAETQNAINRAFRNQIWDSLNEQGRMSFNQVPREFNMMYAPPRSAQDFREAAMATEAVTSEVLNVTTEYDPLVDIWSFCTYHQGQRYSVRVLDVRVSELGNDLIRFVVRRLTDAINEIEQPSPREQFERQARMRQDMLQIRQQMLVGLITREDCERLLNDLRSRQ